MKIKEITALPFPIIVTEEDGLIKDYNHNAQQVLQTIARGEHLTKLVKTIYESKSYQLVSYKGKNYLLLSKTEDTEIFYMLFNGDDHYNLMEKLKELDKSNRELDAIIENSYDGIYITDRDGMTLKTNSAIERITGIPKHYYVGKNINELIRRGILKASVTPRVVETRDTVSLVQKNHNQKETLLTGSPIFNEEGEIEKVVTNIRDLSDLNKLTEQLNKAQKLNEKYKHELEKLKAHTRQDPHIILNSKKMQELFTIAERLANVDTTVLILGETGVGKDVFARHLYRVSNRYDQGKFIKVNCGAIPKDLLESELFGYEAGAFSGANRSGKPGMFELADQGILFLDEVGELPLALQVKLLRVLQEKEIQRVGGTKMKKVNVRVVAATNQDLKQMVRDGEFREDLYYRLHVVPVSIPPLRERRDDILPLVQYFIDQNNQKYEISKSFDRDLKEFCYHYHWPGNVRELSNLVERLMLTVPTKVLKRKDLPDEYHTKEEQVTMTIVDDQPQPKIKKLKEAVEDAEAETLRQAAQTWKTTYEIAKQLETSQATVVRKLKKYHISFE
ncbi:sigma-54 interaction domain-containing protein [Desertibacillus haloalkaliphilus]|uniref:sigma-54 interaction domain-containing protein n=1 Tax=Desertibacillus haloalkaliphilus TaxID=1328930 RepID=UPI001C27894C|nr:sigma 54-interacting transcriptional regulator [Desertibacillus haloalkaliphilus]MBU8906082.1 sigma 54-interacting transcriptional regulator [Desertibacillus haloalkaliphilus]